ncbi:MAG: CBS domain-containing protein [Methanosphaera sp.]|nr:CBS domain-containing protein [Methanosphaera sp.]
MIVKDVMNKNIYTVELEEPVKNALKKMYDLGIQRLFVFNKLDEVVGVITYRDLVVLFESSGQPIDINLVKVSDIMTENVNTISADSSIQDVANLMVRADISGLLVEENGENIGVITKTDICRAVSLSEIITK